VNRAQQRRTARQNGWKSNKSVSKNRRTLAEAIAFAEARDKAQKEQAERLAESAKRIERIRTARHLTEMGIVLPGIGG
jgi:hypothetical protein